MLKVPVTKKSLRKPSFSLIPFISKISSSADPTANDNMFWIEHMYEISDCNSQALVALSTIRVAARSPSRAASKTTLEFNSGDAKYR